MPDEPDTPDLRPAAESPWYVLMTVAGEQTGDFINTDWDLHARNRRYWNGWQAQALSADEKARLIADGRATAADLAELTEEEQTEIDNALGDRCPDAERPAPDNKVDLRYKKFTTLLSARGFLFPRVVNFDNATFSLGADFVNATFPGYADFRYAAFSECAAFEGATFSWPALFRGATFSEYAAFGGATFSVNAAFEGATFSEYAAFSGVTFSGHANFSDATFQAATSFGPGRNWDGSPRPVRFQRDPPEFYGATLREDTDFTDVEWPPVPEDADAQERRARAIRHRRAYERLKLLMDSQKKVADELMFQRLELRCREVEAPGAFRAQHWVTALASRYSGVGLGDDCRRIEAEAARETGEWVVSRTSRLFGLLSKYGWDPVRPVLWLVGLIFAGWVLIGIAEYPDLGVGQAAAVSASNVFAFLRFNRTFLSEEIAALGAVSELVAAAQTVLGLILIFLLGLTLRNRFRIK